MLWMCIWMSPYHIIAGLVGQAIWSYLNIWVFPQEQSTCCCGWVTLDPFKMAIICCRCAYWWLESLPCYRCSCWTSYLKLSGNIRNISWGANHSVLRWLRIVKHIYKVFHNLHMLLMCRWKCCTTLLLPLLVKFLKVSISFFTLGEANLSVFRWLRLYPSKVALKWLWDTYKVFCTLYMLWMCIFMSSYHITAACWPSYLKSPENMNISWGVNHSVFSV